MEAVVEKGGITIRVIRPGTVTEKHPSETALDDAKFDYEIINDGTMEELVKKVREILVNEELI
jgi:MOSC domain-containing protein YiiM